jgi:hypothetical protein
MAEVALKGFAGEYTKLLTLKFELLRFEFKVTLLPAHNVAGEAVGVNVAPSMTPTLKVPDCTPQPATVAVKVYCVVDDGEAAVTSEVEEERVAAGDQLAPVALITFAAKLTVPPAEQISPLAGSELTNGRTLKFTGTRSLKQDPNCVSA